MLTKHDLSAIAEIVDTSIDKRLTTVLDNRLRPIQKDIKNIQSDMKIVQKDIRVMLAVLDRADVELRKRVERIEEHLGITSPS